jgi:Zn finger protein HypA/HybF involved in hydrogenase expression
MTNVENEVLASGTIEETEVSQCGSCGGNTVYDPMTRGLKCPFCGTEVEIEGTRENTTEHDYLDALDHADHSWSNEKRVFKCDNCGAETLLDNDKVADFCTFCGSSHIAITEHDAGIKPALVLPFQISKEQAVEKFKTWIAKRYFAPSRLKKDYELQKISGAYIPYWTFDSDTKSSYTVKIGTYYYVTVTRTVHRDGKAQQVTEQVRKIRWRTQHGRYSEFFDDVLVKASRNVASGLIDKVEPFQLGGLLDYKTEYLSGFLAERYSIPLKEGWLSARSIIDQRIRNGILRKETGDEVRIVKVDTSYDGITFKHILLPLWISSFNFNNKVYRFLVNGQTGKVSGKAPVSIWKVTFIVLLTVLIAAIVFMFQDMM